MHIRPHETLVVWKEAHQLCLKMYSLTKTFPGDERFRLVSQICRSAYSVPMNIAEGNARRSVNEKRHFSDISLGSLEELHYQLTLAKDLNYVPQDMFVTLDDHIQRTSFLLVRWRNRFVQKP